MAADWAADAVMSVPDLSRMAATAPLSATQDLSLRANASMGLLLRSCIISGELILAIIQTAIANCGC